MTYIIIELQTNNGVTAVVPPASYTDRLQAESAFHSILAVAAVSAVEEHAVVMLTGEGHLVRNECYKHPADPDLEEGDA